MEDWRSVAIFADDDGAPCIFIWRGIWHRHHCYKLTRERARRLGRILDGGAEIRRLEISGDLVYTWNDWNWHNIGGKR